jgi:hypothetical protein
MACTPEPVKVFYFMKNINAKVWFDIPNYEGLYSVTWDGEVYSWIRKRILKPDLAKGYLRVTLCKNKIYKRYTVHRLVALVFIDNPYDKKFVNHIDGNKQNNCVRNLEWCTSSENEKHSYNVLNKISGISKLTLNTETGIFYDSITKAANIYNIKPTTLHSKLNGQNKNNTNFINA